jgi:hypothetical protein
MPAAQEENRLKALARRTAQSSNDAPTRAPASPASPVSSPSVGGAGGGKAAPSPSPMQQRSLLSFFKSTPPKPPAGDRGDSASHQPSVVIPQQTASGPATSHANKTVTVLSTANLPTSPPSATRATSTQPLGTVAAMPAPAVNVVKEQTHAVSVVSAQTSDVGEEETFAHSASQARSRLRKRLVLDDESDDSDADTLRGSGQRAASDDGTADDVEMCTAGSTQSAISVRSSATYTSSRADQVPAHLQNALFRSAHVFLTIQMDVEDSPRSPPAKRSPTARLSQFAFGYVETGLPAGFSHPFPSIQLGVAHA